MMHILVVEDNVYLRYTLAEWLRFKGFDVLEAATGDEAVIVLSSVLKVDLVVTDVEMPGSKNGYELAVYIRDKYPALPVIVVSGNASEEKASETGVADFFRKPYNFDLLIGRIESLLPEEQVNGGTTKISQQ
jgi:CheY-like chemotaxis protein